MLILEFGRQIFTRVYLQTNSNLNSNTFESGANTNNNNIDLILVEFFARQQQGARQLVPAVCRPARSVAVELQVLGVQQ